MFEHNTAPAPFCGAPRVQPGTRGVCRNRACEIVESCPRLLDIPIREGLQELHDPLLLGFVQVQVADLRRVHVRQYFWLGPRLYVPSVVEMDDLFQRLEVAVMPVGLDEASWLGGGRRCAALEL